MKMIRMIEPTSGFLFMFYCSPPGFAGGYSHSSPPDFLLFKP